MRATAQFTRSWLAVAALAAACSTPLSAQVEMVFSIAADQYAQTPAGGRTLQQHVVYQSSGAINPFVPAFVPAALGIDAIALDGHGGILFSVQVRGVLQQAPGTIVLEQDRVYRLDRQTGHITPAADWTSWGIGIGTLDALDQLRDGSLVFSTEVSRLVFYPGGQVNLLPQNAYRFDPSSGKISLFFDGRRLSLADLDGIDMLENGRVAFSTATNVQITTPGGVRHLLQENVYVYTDSGDVALFVDGRGRGLYSLDAFDVESMIVVLEGDAIRWSDLATSAGYDVVRGDLAALRTSHGDFRSATRECLANDLAEPEFHYAVDPHPGEGFWLLVRAANGSYDDEEPFQVGSRDPGIAASGLGCP